VSLALTVIPQVQHQGSDRIAHRFTEAGHYLCDHRSLFCAFSGFANLMPLFFLRHSSRAVRRAAIGAATLGGVRFLVPVLLALAAPGGWNVSIANEGKLEFNSADVSPWLWGASLLVFAVLLVMPARLGNRGRG
jgi:hypothetical protein